MDLRNLARWLFDPWLVLGAIGFGVVLSAATLLLLWVTRSPQAADGLPTAAVTVVSLPTATQTAPSPTPTTPVTPTPVQLLPPAPGNISLDAYVQISGTGGDGLRLRTEPGLGSEVRMLGLEAEVFQVKDGPHEADGYNWWYLVAPVDETRRGWAVANYLAVVQNP
ncbi:MAG: hypothetical protein A2Z45_06465 [Chloroflexi bacterium RBG_19FT_COMBO_55_16]|nr:MAG: hypothetical protein A2Z45_06465 [Chloroflexi bacterium RBG_19FT_COMBO_55_16]